jgi:Fe-S cluster assembly protein SufB
MYWTQVETGSGKTWKYPSSVLAEKGASSDFFSLTITRENQQADTGTRMIHLAPHTTSSIVSFGAALGSSRQTFRSQIVFGAENCASASKCDSKIIGGAAAANTMPRFAASARGEYSHEAHTGALDESAMQYLALAGIDSAEAAALLISGIAAPVLSRLPMEFLVESRKLIEFAMRN